jgi:serine/threonine-protein kinase
MNPTQLGPYKIGQRLGRGGMGAVYEAVDTTSGRKVAVKVLASHLADDAGLRRRFESEIDALKNLRHPGIVRLIAFGEQDEQPYFAMELVRGRSLEQLLRDGRRFTWRETISKATEITKALKVAHDVGIVHRDLKPANLLIADVTETPTSGPQALIGDAITVKLADFGIAKLFGGQSHTALGHVVGTAEYMAPEQAMGKPLDHRADLYALGLVMYAMLTGAPPFRGGQLTEIIDKQRRMVPPRVSTLVAAVPPELDELIARLLSKDPAQRPASALALGRLLAAIETLHAAAGAASPGAASQRTPATGGPQQPAPPRRPTAAPPPTALDRSNRPTAPVDPAQRKPPQPAAAPPRRAPDPDPLAPTQDMPAAPRPDGAATEKSVYATAPTRAPATHGGDAATAASAADGSRLPTAVAAATTIVGRAPRNRFMTIEEFERTEAEQSRRDDFRAAVWRWLAAAGIAAAAGGACWLVFAPPSANTLHDGIMAIVNDPHGDLRDARRPIEQFLERHADDPRSAAVRDIKRSLDLDQLDRRSRRPRRNDKGLSPIERDYRAALAAEENGPSAFLQAIQALLAVHGRSDAATPVDEETALWIDLARRQAAKLTAAAEAEQRDDADRIAKIFAEAESLAVQAETAVGETTRKRLDETRRTLLQSVVDVYADRPHAAEAVAAARRLLAGDDAAPADPTPATGTTAPSPRND